MKNTTIGTRKSIDEIIHYSKTNKDKILQSVSTTTIPRQIHSYVSEYNRLQWSRDPFIWQWLWNMAYARNPGFMLSSVPERYRHEIAELKFLLAMAVTIADDVSDKLKDQDLLRVLLDIPFRSNVNTPMHFSYDQLYAVDLFAKILHHCKEILESAVNFRDYQIVFDYDIKQVWNSFEFANLLHQCPQVANPHEYNMYGSHNMMIYVFADIDLMYSRSFQIQELPNLRNVIWYAQQMARIGNWVSTWEREIHESDITSGIVGLAIAKGLIDPQVVLANNSDQDANSIINRIKECRIEDSFFLDWERNRSKIISMASKLKSVNVSEYLDGMELLMLHHLASRGAK